MKSTSKYSKKKTSNLFWFQLFSMICSEKMVWYKFASLCDWTLAGRTAIPSAEISSGRPVMTDDRSEERENVWNVLKYCDLWSVLRIIVSGTNRIEINYAQHTHEFIEKLHRGQGSRFMLLMEIVVWIWSRDVHYACAYWLMFTYAIVSKLLGLESHVFRTCTHKTHISTS